MVWTVWNTVNAVMQRDVTLSPGTVIVWQGGQEFTVTMYALKDAGDPTAPCRVTARTADHAHRRMAVVSVLQDTEEPCAKEFALLDSMDIAAAKHAPSAFTPMDRVITSQAIVTACQDFLAHFVTKFALVEDSVGAVRNSVYAATMQPATPSTARASATRAG